MRVMGQLAGAGGNSRGAGAIIDTRYTTSMRGVGGSDGIERGRPWSFRRWNPPSRGGSPCAIIGGHDLLRGLLTGDIFTEDNRNLRMRTEMAAKRGSLCATETDRLTQNSMIDVT